MRSKAKQKNSSRSGNIITLIILVLFVGYIGINATLFIRDYLTQSNWEQTEAIVVRHNSKTHWLLYEYKVNDQTYYRTRISLTEDSKSELGIPDKSKDLPIGKTLDIYYDPSDPSRAVIYLQADFSNILAISVLIVGALILFVVGRIVFCRYLNWVGKMIKIGDQS